MTRMTRGVAQIRVASDRERRCARVERSSVNARVTAPSRALREARDDVIASPRKDGHGHGRSQRGAFEQMAMVVGVAEIDGRRADSLGAAVCGHREIRTSRLVRIIRLGRR